MDASDLNISMAVFDDNGKGHAFRWRITSEKALLHHGLLKEIEYTLGRGTKYLMRDLKHAAQSSRPTNPFSWSPGPTQW